MIIKVLVEDTARHSALAAEHGLSLYIETAGRRILFDMGATDLWLQNARVLGVDPESIDLAVLSHGHYDHGGGLAAFLAAKSHAPVYIHRRAFEKHRALRTGGAGEDIGLDPALKDNPRLLFGDGVRTLGEGLTLFTAEGGEPLRNPANAGLLTQRDGRYMPDDFAHEQSLAIDEDGRTVLITGCAHRGVAAIMAQWQLMGNATADIIVGGFHLSRGGREADPAYTQALGLLLVYSGARIYTGHCTGAQAAQRLQGILNDRLGILTTGTVLEI